MRGTSALRQATAPASRRKTRAARGGTGIAVLASAVLVASLTCGSAAAAARRTDGPASARASEWPSYLNGPKHTSYSASQATITAANATDLELKWHVTNGAYLASPTVADGAVFIGSPAAATCTSWTRRPARC